ncbi:MAG: sugar transferase [Flavobacteriaceae bacterium]
MYPTIKHSLDFCFAFVLGVILFPLGLLVTLLIAIQNGGNPFFSQLRPGKEGHFFTIYKFKTMRDTKDEKGDLLPDVQRTTPLGKIIRKLSLDELPQLWNILKGEMSFVGPRPLLPEYVPLYDKNQWRRHHVRPGMTGWAQVNGRNTLSWKEKFTFDIAYVDQQSFGLDCKIIIKTMIKLFQPTDVNANTTLTMEPFNGKN